jgi:hypothetical protein
MPLTNGYGSAHVKSPLQMSGSYSRLLGSNTRECKSAAVRVRTGASNAARTPQSASPPSA